MKNEEINPATMNLRRTDGIERTQRACSPSWEVTIEIRTSLKSGLTQLRMLIGMSSLDGLVR